MTFTFTGRGIAWFGPQGPTRGKAEVWLDGKHFTTVDLYRRAFKASANVWATGWDKTGEHTLTIRVLGTKGRAMVAVDQFRVTP